MNLIVYLFFIIDLNKSTLDWFSDFGELTEDLVENISQLVDKKNNTEKVFKQNLKFIKSVAIDIIDGYKINWPNYKIYKDFMFYQLDQLNFDLLTTYLYYRSEKDIICNFLTEFYLEFNFLKKKRLILTLKLNLDLCEVNIKKLKEKNLKTIKKSIKDQLLLLINNNQYKIDPQLKEIMIKNIEFRQKNLIINFKEIKNKNELIQFLLNLKIENQLSSSDQIQDKLSKLISNEIKLIKQTINKDFIKEIENDLDYFYLSKFYSNKFLYSKTYYFINNQLNLPSKLFINQRQRTFQINLGPSNKSRIKKLNFCFYLLKKDNKKDLKLILSKLNLNFCSLLYIYVWNLISTTKKLKVHPGLKNSLKYFINNSELMDKKKIETC